MDTLPNLRRNNKKKGGSIGKAVGISAGVAAAGTGASYYAGAKHFEKESGKVIDDAYKKYNAATGKNLVRDTQVKKLGKVSMDAVVLKHMDTDKLSAVNKAAKGKFGKGAIISGLIGLGAAGLAYSSSKGKKNKGSY